MLSKISKYLLVFILLFPSAAFSQYYFFGRNKVQYDKFDWKVLKTEHFDIYYYNELEEIASIGASFAEEAYDDLKVKFNHIVTRRIPLIFYNTHLHFQQTNTTPGFIPEGVGGFFEFLKGRVVIPYLGSLKDFQHVIKHELVHVFMMNKIFRVLADHRIPTEVQPPLWFVEGLAEHFSTDTDDQAEMVMRDAVLNNYFVGLKEMYKIYGSFLMYKEGQSFLDFVRDKYGNEKVYLLLENFWMYTSFTKVIEHTIGKPLEEIDSEWSFYLKRKYYPLLGEKYPSEHGAKKITNQGFNFSPVYYELEGEQYLYFVANRDGYSSIYRINLSIEESKENYPEVELILRGEKQEEFEAFHLFQSSIDISHEGMLAFVTKSGATDVIHFYSVGEKKIVNTFKRDELISISSPKFSESGSKVVFRAIDQKGFSDIFLLRLNTDDLTRLTNDYYDDQDPVFGNDENQILFSSDRSAGNVAKHYNIFSFDLPTYSINYITALNSNNHSPVLSGDKKTLLFTSDQDGVRNIWKMKLDNGKFSSRIDKVTNFVTSVFDPVFKSNDRIVFSGFEKFSFNLYEYNYSADSSIQSSTMNFASLNGNWKAKHLEAEKERESFKYEKEYTLDYAQSQISTDPVFGTRGGAILSLSDLLGDDNYFFLIYNTAETQSDFLKSFNVAVSRFYLGERANYGYGIFHFSGRRYDIRDSDEFFFERSFGGYFILNFPLSKFGRIEAGLTIANSDKQVIANVIERKALLWSNSLSYVFDNSIWAPTGPVDGTRARLLVGYTSDIKFSNVNYFTLIADYREYFRLGLRSALAFRSALFYNEGKEARRYFMGGSWDLRGWPRWSIRGEKLWLSSLEVRVPLIDQIRIQFPFLELGFSSIRAAAFFDAGGAWDKEYKTTLGSVGAGVRMNLFGFLVLRYDIGKKIEQDFNKLQKGVFYQFFFGWDF